MHRAKVAPVRSLLVGRGRGGRGGEERGERESDAASRERPGSSSLRVALRVLTLPLTKSERGEPVSLFSRL